MENYFWGFLKIRYSLWVTFLSRTDYMKSIPQLSFYSTVLQMWVQARINSVTFLSWRNEKFWVGSRSHTDLYASLETSEQPARLWVPTTDLTHSHRPGYPRGSLVPGPLLVSSLYHFGEAEVMWDNIHLPLFELISARTYFLLVQHIKT